MNPWICHILNRKWVCSIWMQMFYLRIQTRVEFSNKKQQKFVLSGAKHTQDICAASWHSVFPSWQQWLQAGWDQQLLTGDNATCVVLKSRLALRFFIHRQCGQYCHNLWLWELESSSRASLQQYRWRPYAFTMNRRKLTNLRFEYNGSLCYLPYRVKISVVHIVLVYQYLALFTCRILVLVTTVKPDAKETSCKLFQSRAFSLALYFRHGKWSFGGICNN